MESSSVRPPDPSAPGPGPTAQRIDQVIETAEQAATEIRSAAEAQAQRELDAVRTQADTMTRERVAMVSELTEALLEHATLIASQCENLVLALESTMRRLGPASQDAPLEAQGAGAIGAGSPPPPPAPRTTAWPPAEPPPPAAPPPQPETSQAADDGESEAEPQRSADARESTAADPEDRAEQTPEPAERDLEPHEGGSQADDEPGDGPSAWSPPPVPASAGGGASDEAYLSATRLALGGSSRSEIAEELEREFGIDDPDPILDRVLGAD